MFKGMSVKEFNRNFQTDEDCCLYLFRLKWANGYRCRKCANKAYHKGKSKYHFRCTNCLYGESPTANTIFHKMKVPLLKAFGMIFRITVKKKGISTLELSREFAIDKKTAWLFKRKMQEVMTGFQNTRLNGPVDSACFIFGGAESEWKSKFQGEESNAILVVEKPVGNRLGNAGGWINDENSSGNANEKRVSFLNDLRGEGIIDQKANLFTEKLPLTFNSRSGAQILVFNLKNWIRGIHHHCSGRFANGYLQEFIFRYNRRNNLKMILHQTIAAGIFHKPYFYKPIKPSLGNRSAEDRKASTTNHSQPT